MMCLVGDPNNTNSAAPYAIKIFHRSFFCAIMIHDHVLPLELLADTAQVGELCVRPITTDTTTSTTSTTRSKDN